jgi:RNA polymerase sigma-70 factor (ECF subfamily)
MNEKQFIKALKKMDRNAQKELYELYSSRYFALCRRYLIQYDEAQDALVKAFYKIMTSMDKYHGTGSFEGWMRRIVVNECLMSLRKNQHFHLNLETAHQQAVDEVNIIDDLAYRELIACMEKLPQGYRTIFNMYVIEGYKHREIGEILGISINTSKSQLILAKKRMAEIIKKKQGIDLAS